MQTPKTAASSTATGESASSSSSFRGKSYVPEEKRGLGLGRCTALARSRGLHLENDDITAPEGAEAPAILLLMLCSCAAPRRCSVPPRKRIHTHVESAI